MKHSTMLADLLQSTFALHRARITCLATIVIALFKVKTVNLAQLATAFPTPPTSIRTTDACNASSSTSDSNCSPGIIRARFPTRYPLHPGSGSNSVDAWKETDQLPHPVRCP